LRNFCGTAASMIKAYDEVAEKGKFSVLGSFDVVIKELEEILLCDIEG